MSNTCCCIVNITLPCNRSLLRYVGTHKIVAAHKVKQARAARHLYDIGVDAESCWCAVKASKGTC
jgi:hypothetical protein